MEKTLEELFQEQYQRLAELQDTLEKMRDREEQIRPSFWRQILRWLRNED